MERLTQFDEFGNADIVGVDSDDLQLNLDFEQFNKVTNALNQLAYYENLAEVFEEKLQPEVFEFLKDEDELSKWLDRILYSVRKLNEYAIAEEQGLLLRLPCKVGDTVYSITWWDDKTERIKVKGKTYYRTIREHKVTKEKFSLSQLYKFGEEVFLTKKEAEAKLEELRGNANEV